MQCNAMQCNGGKEKKVRMNDVWFEGGGPVQLHHHHHHQGSKEVEVEGKEVNHYETLSSTDSTESSQMTGGKEQVTGFVMIIIVTVIVNIIVVVVIIIIDHDQHCHHHQHISKEFRA